MLALLVQRRRLIQFVDAAIDAGADEALRTQLFNQGQVFALAFTHDWCQQHQFAAFRHGQHLIDHLADGLGGQRQVVVRAHRGADAGKQQAQVVVDLGDGADGGARVVRGGLLLDRDGWR